MLGNCYRELGEWEALLRLLPAMQKAGVIDEERARELRQEAAMADLRRSRDPAELESRYRSLPRPMQRTAEVVRAFADHAVRLGAPELTEEPIRNGLKVAWDSTLRVAYGEPGL